MNNNTPYGHTLEGDALNGFTTSIRYSNNIVLKYTKNTNNAKWMLNHIFGSTPDENNAYALWYSKLNSIEQKKEEERINSLLKLANENH